MGAGLELHQARILIENAGRPFRPTQERGGRGGLPRSAFLGLLLIAVTSCASTGVPQGTPSLLHARNVLLAPGETFRIDLDAGSGGFQIRADFEPSDARLELCPVTDGTPVDAERCLQDVAWGVRTPVPGFEVDALRFRVTDRAVDLDLSIEFFERSREMRFVLPRIPPAPSQEACVDNACNPFFEFTPTRSGDLVAEARFEGEAELVVLSGRVLAEAETATGLPYREAARHRGSAPLSVQARLTAGDEFALAIRQQPGPDADGLGRVALSATWP